MTANGITMRHTISRNPELMSNRLLPPASTSVVVVRLYSPHSFVMPSDEAYYLLDV